MKKSKLGVILLQTIFVTSCFTYEFDPEFSCDFSHDTCKWTNTKTSEQFIRQSGGTSLQGTGPSAGHTNGGQNDYYIYLGTYGDSSKYAQLVSPLLNTTCDLACFRFWYHMYGKYVNKFDVGLINGNPLLNISRESYNEWKCGFISIPSCSDKQIYIRAYESEEGLQSQIAFDDLVLVYVDSPNQCSKDVCGLNAGDFTSTTMIAASSTSPTSTLTITISSSKAPDTTSGPIPSTRPPTSQALYLFSLLAVPFIILVIGIVYIKKRRSKNDSSMNNFSSNNDSRDGNGYTSDPTSRDLPETPDENVYLELTEDLRRPDDGEYIHPFGKNTEGNYYTQPENVRIKETSIDNTADEGYISAVGMTDVKHSRHLDTGLHRALPAPPDMSSTSVFRPEVENTLGENEDYLHPVSDTNKVENSKMPENIESMASEDDDDYLKPTKSVVISEQFCSATQFDTQPQYENQETCDQSKRESSTTI